MPVDEAPEDSEVRETFNFAPGNYGVVYRTNTSDHGYIDAGVQDAEIAHEPSEEQMEEAHQDHVQEKKLKHKLQSMKWGLVPFWTKRQPDYGSLMRTINCRDDSLIEDRGMWTTMKRRKRCVVICQGFYEWLKKGPGGKEKIPHFVKRKDGGLMCLAGLWDCVTYEGNPHVSSTYNFKLTTDKLTYEVKRCCNGIGSDEKLYTYTIITTSSNSYLKFLHDRMPVILDPGSKEMKIWLDPTRTTWSKDLQSVLEPYEGELECYAVPKEVGKVGNNSPDFILPINNKENKSNIANFFANAKKQNGKDAPAPTKKDNEESKSKPKSPEKVDSDLHELKVVHESDENRATEDTEWSEDNAPVPVEGIKREHPPQDREEVPVDEYKRRKLQDTTGALSPGKTHGGLKLPPKPPAAFSGSTTHSAARASPSLKKKDEKKTGNSPQKITSFFKV